MRAAVLAALVIAGCKAEEKNPAISPSQTAPLQSSSPSSNTPARGEPQPQSAAQPPPRVPPVTSSATGSTTSGNDVLATIDGMPITRAAVEKPLIEAYGLNMLAKVAQLELAKREATTRGVTVFDTDLEKETDRYLTTLFNEDKDPILRQMQEELQRAETANDAKRIEQSHADMRRERFKLLDQLLQQQKLSRADFDLAMQTNTYLRKIAQSAIKKEKITEENLQQAFSQIYGEKVQIRHIALSNLQEATEAKRRVASGEPFEKVAREMSRNQQSGMMGGELPPFSRDNGAYPRQFIDVAFSLRPGEVSDPVAAAGGYHLIKLDQRIAPKIVKLDDVRESVRDDLYERQIEAFVHELSNQLKLASVNTLKITEPTLKKQFDAQVLKKDEEITNKQEVQRDFNRRLKEIQDKAAATTRAATTQPAATQP